MKPDKLWLLIELIDELVNEDRPYAEKLGEVVIEATDAEMVSVREFASWYNDAS